MYSEEEVSRIATNAAEAAFMAMKQKVKEEVNATTHAFAKLQEKLDSSDDEK